ncbi:MAG: hypothetical protein ACRCVJ_12970 [Clostridium sp.]|uniref:hypothetical protein n=1 Tax=Clostridium sp. TaxID=1506 RepID=UPI003F2FC59C
MTRCRVILEFNLKKEEEMKLYECLSKFSNPGATAKDMLRGLLPLPSMLVQNGAIRIQK